MFKQIFRKNNKKKNNIQKEPSINSNEKEESNFNINITKENNIFKFEITDYAQLIDCIMKVKSIGAKELYEQISFNILWNSDKQQVNKGIYYIINDNGTLYNILINGKTIALDERIIKEFDLQTLKENITHEKTIRINIATGHYKYCYHKHDSKGSTFYTRIYNKNRVSKLDWLDLSEEEALNEINEVFNNLERIEGIHNIIDLELLKSYIVDDLRINTSKLIRKK